jgi:hypothetical protein
MPTTSQRLTADPLKRVPPTMRPTVEAVRRLVKAVAPHAVEVGYRSQSPCSTSALWKLARYRVDGKNVVGIGTFRAHALLFFYQGRQLDDRTALFEGGGKAMRFIRLHSPADARRLEVRRIMRSAFALAAQQGSVTTEALP